MTQPEARSVEFRDAEVKGRKIRGYAAVFETPWSDELTEAMGYVETVARGAFRKALSTGRNVPLLWQHERRDMLATTKAGTLKLREDGNGLLVEADLPTNPLGEYVREMIERGDVRGMSYGMQTLPEDSSLRRDGNVYYRTIRNVRNLVDTTLTWEPSYPDATVELRSMGFTALTIQEITGGEEAQTGEAEGGKSSAASLFGRMANLRISVLEKGGTLE